jgi:hypothetical protein
VIRDRVDPGAPEPARWRELPDATPGATIILRGARRPRPPAPEELTRLGAAIGQMPRRSLAASLRTARFIAAAAAAITLLVVGGGVWAWRGHRETIAPTGVAASTERAVVMAPENRPAPALAPAPAARPAARPRVAHRVVTAPPPVDALTREIALVDDARRDIATAPARALAAANAHRRAFPEGQLAAEREFLAIEALRRLGRIDEARLRARALEARYPTSSYAARAARLLQPAP